ncbi:AAA family ATPase [Micromonospora sp. DR5-3]|uniref:ATP-binding protein n=1 Tax=unclassified Micromonospora TaxID=2617518 RepID=UPI001652A980|nr:MULTISPECIES: AAA family ATPase [unclassified Micromonospora]MCW3817748.1 AAA family ATPase [Micromonospora sp. DR5-3]
MGRARELTALAQAMAQSPALVLIEGEAGIGKSRLVLEFLASPAMRARRVLVAVCPPFREPDTLGPLLDAIRQATETVTGLGLSALAGTLRPFFPEWAADLPPPPEPLDDPRAARHRLFRALVELLDRLRIAVLVVEDAHWADEATVEFLLFLVTRPVVGSSSRPGLLVTYRPEDLPADTPVVRLSSRRPAGTTQLRIPLGGLDVAQTGRLMSSMVAGEAISAEFVEFLHRHTAGIPLAIEEVLRLLHDRADLTYRGEGWARRRLDRIDIPATVRDAVLERAARLGLPAQAVLRAAAVLADPSDWAMLAAVSGLASGDADQGLSEAIQTGLLQQDSRGLFSVRYPLAARAVYDTIPPAERRVLHRRAAELLQHRTPAPLARLARHFREAGEVASWLRYAELAVEVALGSADEAAAAALLYQLLESPDLPVGDVARLVDKVPFVTFTGPARLDILVRALRRAMDCASLPVRERNLARLHLARLLSMGGEIAAAHDEAERSVAELPPGSLEAVRAMVLLGWPELFAGTMAANLDWLRRSAAARESGWSPADRLNLVVGRASALLRMGEESGWVEAVTIPRDVPDATTRQHVTRGHLNFGDSAMCWGRYGQARHHLAVALALAEQHDLMAVRDVVLATQVHLDWFVGEWADLADRADAVAGGDDPSPIIWAEAKLVAGMVRAATGASVPDLTAVLDVARRYSLAELYMETAAAIATSRLADGDVDAALSVTEEPVRIVAARGIWLWGVPVVPVRVDALVAAERLDAAADLVGDFARGMRGRDIPAARAARVQARAAVAEARGDRWRAAALYRRAAGIWRSLPRPYAALRAAELSAANNTTDGGQADLADVLEGFAALGASRDADRVRRQLRDLGVSAPRRARGRPSYGDRLSPRELDVVRLLLAGRTNRQIAEDLVLSVQTVAGHLKSAMRKLRVSSRTGVAVRVVELGLLSEDAATAADN